MYIIDKEKLKKRSSESSSMLDIGKAAEHLVCANLLISGYKAFLADQGMSYDVVLETNDRLYRIQVKGCCFPGVVNRSSRSKCTSYLFHIRRRGKNGKNMIRPGDCDLVAFVALDQGLVAYLPFSSTPRGLTIAGPGCVDERVLSRVARFDEFPIEAAICGVENPTPWVDRRGRLVEVNGRKLKISEWSSETGIPKALIEKRLSSGWPPERAITTPVDISKIHKQKRTPEAIRRRAEQASALAEKRSAAKKAWWNSMRAQKSGETTPLNPPVGFSALDRRDA